MAAAAVVAAIPLARAQQATPTPAPSQRPAIITLPGAERFSLPPSGEQPVRPTPVPTPTPSARPVPPPVVATVPQPGPTRAVATPTPTSAPTRAVTPAPTPTAAASPNPVPQLPVAVPSPVASASPVAAPAAPAPAAPVWLWIALGAVAAIGLAAWAFLRRRRPEADEELPKPVAPVRAVPPPSAPRPAPPPRPSTPAPEPEPIAIELRPRRLVIDGAEAVLDIELVLGNGAAVSADGLRLGLAMVSASPQQDLVCAAFHGGPPIAPVVEPFDLAAGQGRAIGGRLRLAREHIHVVQIGGRAMFVPLVLVDLRWRSGLSLRHHGADFMVGTAALSGVKLGPIWLDRRQHEGLAASRYTPRPIDPAALSQPAA